LRFDTEHEGTPRPPTCSEPQAGLGTALLATPLGYADGLRVRLLGHLRLDPITFLYVSV
jgi:hypothetical protein